MTLQRVATNINQAVTNNMGYTGRSNVTASTQSGPTKKRPRCFRMSSWRRKPFTRAYIMSLTIPIRTWNSQEHMSGHDIQACTDGYLPPRICFTVLADLVHPDPDPERRHSALRTGAWTTCLCEPRAFRPVVADTRPSSMAPTYTSTSTPTSTSTYTYTSTVTSDPSLTT